MDFSVILLERCPKRKHNTQELQKQLPNLYIHPAVDAKTLRQKDIKHLSKHDILPKDLSYDYICNRPHTKEQFAIWLSHVSLWEHLLKTSNHNIHIILEDDVQLQPNFFRLMKKYLHKFESMDFCQLYVFPQQLQRMNIKRRGVYKGKPGLWGTQCYMINHRALASMISAIKPMQTAIDEHVTRLNMKKYFIHDDFVIHDTTLKSYNRVI